MRAVALLPSIAVLAGVYAGIAWARPVPLAAAFLIVLWSASLIAWRLHAPRAVVATVVSAFVLAGAALGAEAARVALAPTIRAVLDQAYGGFGIDDMNPPGAHPPIRVRGRLEDDAAVREFGVQLRVQVEFLQLENDWQAATGGVRVTIAGDAAAARASTWRRGRTIEAPATFRRPARYLNDGVPDFERDAALAGAALNASVKSGLLAIEFVLRIARVRGVVADAYDPAKRASI